MAAGGRGGEVLEGLLMAVAPEDTVVILDGDGPGFGGDAVSGGCFLAIHFGCLIGILREDAKVGAGCEGGWCVVCVARYAFVARSVCVARFARIARPSCIARSAPTSCGGSRITPHHLLNCAGEGAFSGCIRPVDDIDVGG